MSSGGRKSQLEKSSPAGERKPAAAAATPLPQEDGPFSLGRIRQLVRLMRDNDLSEIDLSWEGSRLRLRRGTLPAVIGAAPHAVPAPAAPSLPAPPAEPAAKAADGVFISSPIVGTFYSAASPDSGPFVSAGSRVEPDTIVCIIEAMKVFNEIPAGVRGVIREVLVENGAPVEYNQPLFRVEP